MLLVYDVCSVLCGYLWMYGVSKAPDEDEGVGEEETRREVYPLIKGVASAT